MGYEYDCDSCDHSGEYPMLMGQFSERVYASHPMGDQLKALGYDLGDTITLCPQCTYELLESGLD